MRFPWWTPLADVDWIVAGLGNPGRRYSGTRHDLGYVVVDRLAAAAGLRFRDRGDGAEAGPFVPAPGGARALLLKPLLFMNRSGPPIAARAARCGLAADRVLVLCDDLNLPLGRLRLRGEGSAGGHNGLHSILEVLGPGFPRLRMGIGRPPEGVDPSEWVLGHFAQDEMEAVEEMLEGAEAVVRDVIVRGVAAAVTSMPAPARRPRENSKDSKGSQGSTESTEPEESTR